MNTVYLVIERFYNTAAWSWEENVLEIFTDRKTAEKFAENYESVNDDIFYARDYTVYVEERKVNTWTWE